MKKIRTVPGLIPLIIMGLIPLYPLFFPGLPLTHDGQDHVARIANFYASLSDGNIIPRWAASLNWGYGHPILMFLYPLPSYMSSLFHLIGFNFVDSLKIVFGLTYILSGVFMYFWIRNIFGEKGGVIAGMLYMFAPYRFVDLFVRGAIGEHVAFLFVPLIFYFMYKISASARKNGAYNIGLALSVAGLILSHNAVTLMFLPLIGAYGIILLMYAENRKVLLSALCFFILLGIGLSAFFVLPAFLEGKYTLRDIVTRGGEYRDRFVTIVSLLSPAWSFGGSDSLSKQIGILQLIGVTGSFFVIKKLKKEKKWILTVLLASLIFSIFIMLPISDFIWRNVSILQKFQFPWRFLSVVVFCTAVLSASSVVLIKNRKSSFIFTAAVCFLAVLLNSPYYKVQGYLQKPENFYTGIYDSTTDTGESAPVWSIRFMEKRPKGYAEFINGSGSIKSQYRDTATRKYEILVESKEARIRENTLYFPNWVVVVNGKKQEIEFQDPQNRGLITYNLPNGKSTIIIKFEDTRLRVISNAVSAISIFMILGYVVIFRFIKK